MIGRAWRAWLALLDARETGESLALFRIAAGLCVLALLGTARARGLLDALWVDAAYGGVRNLHGAWLVRALGGPTPGVIDALNAGGLLAGVCLVLGLGSRAAAAVALLSLNALVRTHPDVGGGYDSLLTNALWLLVLARAGTVWSLDARLLRTPPGELVPAWPRGLAVFQLCLMYFMAGIQKVGASWTPAGNFAALYYILQQPSWQRWDMSWVAPLYPLTQVATGVTWVWEVLWPLVGVSLWLRARPKGDAGRLRRLVARDWRLPFCVLGVVMHTLTWLFLEVGPFSWVTLSFYPCLFSPDEHRAALARARALLSRFRRGVRRPDAA